MEADDMPSPFPGVDPYIENQEWQDFHTRFNTVLSELLASRLEPRYVVRVERRVYVEHPTRSEGEVRWADVAVLSSSGATAMKPSTASGAAASVASPVECLLPMPEERREAYLVIRERETMEVVTVIETLSPANKQAGGDGREQYLAKRDLVLESRSHLVELDLLRGGLRLPTVSGLPPGDYYAIVSRRRRRPRAEVYAWGIRQPLPMIPVPLREGDEDVELELQTAFTTVYDRARYHLSIDYSAALEPPLTEADQSWARELLAARRS
jgi:hypothetical protein